MATKFFRLPVPKAQENPLFPQWVDTKEAWNCMPHSNLEVLRIPVLTEYGKQQPTLNVRCCHAFLS